MDRHILFKHTFTLGRPLGKFAKVLSSGRTDSLRFAPPSVTTLCLLLLDAPLGHAALRYNFMFLLLLGAPDSWMLAWYFGKVALATLIQ